MFRAVALVVLAACAQVAHGQVLWQDLSAGMALDEVRRAVPAAQTVNNPTIKMTTGAQGKLRSPGVELAGKPFDATFFFVGDRLSDVHLTHEARQAAPLGRATYNELLATLRAKYGQEAKSEGSGSSQETNWVADRKTVTLLGFFSGGETVISVVYSGAFWREAPKQ